MNQSVNTSADLQVSQLPQDIVCWDQVFRSPDGHKIFRTPHQAVHAASHSRHILSIACRSAVGHEVLSTGAEPCASSAGYARALSRYGGSGQPIIQAEGRWPEVHGKCAR